MFFRVKTRAERDYSQGKRRTQGKTAKKAGKMQVFLGHVEIPCKNAGSARSRTGKNAGTAMLRSIHDSGIFIGQPEA
jgi:hypothetical protein